MANVSAAKSAETWHRTTTRPTGLRDNNITVEESLKLVGQHVAPSVGHLEQAAAIERLAAFEQRTFAGNIRPFGVFSGEPFFVDEQRIDHPVLMERDDELAIEKRRRVIIGPGLLKCMKFNWADAITVRERIPDGSRRSARSVRRTARRKRPATCRPACLAADSGTWTPSI